MIIAMVSLMTAIVSYNVALGVFLTVMVPRKAEPTQNVAARLQ